MFEMFSQVTTALTARKAVLVAVTGWGQEQHRELAREAGFDHHLTKPIDPDRLDELLADLRPR